MRQLPQGWRCAAVLTLLACWASSVVVAQQQPKPTVPKPPVQQPTPPAANVAPAAKIPTSIIVGTKRDIAADAAINQKLDQEIDLATEKLPLNEFADLLSKKTGLSIQLDHKALEAAGVGFDTPISRHLSKVSARSALRLVLKQLGLTFMIQDEVLLITTFEEANNKLQVRIYPVRDLIVHRGPHVASVAPAVHKNTGGIQAADSSPPTKTNMPPAAQTPAAGREAAPHEDVDELIQLITSTIQPNSWGDLAGQGNVKYLDSVGSLVFAQTPEVHEEVVDLIEALREAKRVQE